MLPRLYPLERHSARPSQRTLNWPFQRIGAPLREAQDAARRRSASRLAASSDLLGRLITIMRTAVLARPAAGFHGLFPLLTGMLDCPS